MINKGHEFGTSQRADRLKRSFISLLWLVLGLVIIPLLYITGVISIETVNKLGRYMTYALVAVGLDLIWGYAGILGLCQALFFCLGGYAMGMYLAHHGGPEGIIDKTGWKLPACLYVVYPYKVSEAPQDALVPWFWKPFWSLPITVVLGLVIPGTVAFIIGYFVFRSRVRGVYFAILTQAITVAAQNFFSMNNMKFCGTNGLTRFEKIAGFELANSKVQFSLYLLTVVMLFLVYVLYRYIINSRLGRILIAVRDDENTLRFSGYKPYLYKLFAFVLAAATAGLAGMLYVPQMKIITPHNLGAERSILIVIYVAVGGRSTLSGAIIGALGVSLMYDNLTSTIPWAWPYVLGSLFIAVVLGYPDGLVKLPQKLFNKFKRPTAEDKLEDSPTS